MVQNPPEGNQRIIPYLIYKDAEAAIDYLTKSFGFEERFRIPGPGGIIGHAELGYAGETVMLATASDSHGHKTPTDAGGTHSLVHVYVDDVDAHYAHAKAQGVDITRELEDQFYGDRSYMAKDPEGHVWSFATHVKEVSPEEMLELMKNMG